jgi:hypothetical protein
MFIYYKSHKNCIRQNVFSYALQKHHTLKAKPVILSNPEQSILDLKATYKALQAFLQDNPHLPSKFYKLLSELKKIKYHHINVYRPNYPISCDIILHRETKKHFIEFHEEQHRNLKDNRLQKIYSADYKSTIIVPRYVQRFLRDIWRTQNMQPLTIIWSDWYDKYKEVPESFFHHKNLTEHHLKNTFSFAHFLKYFR